MDFILGAFLAMSSGFGFQNGVGAEALLTGKYGEARVAYTTEQKLYNEYGYTWSSSIIGTLPVGNAYVGAGWSSFGYSADQWTKQDDGATFCLGFRNSRLDIRAYYIDAQVTDEVVGVVGDFQVVDGFSVALDVTHSTMFNATGVDIGMRYRF